jgi:hypothetical protein
LSCNRQAVDTVLGDRATGRSRPAATARRGRR